MTACLIGPNQNNFPFDYNDDFIKKAVYQDKLCTKTEKLIKNGCRNFISGLVIGAELDFANTVIYLRDVCKNDGINITLEAVIEHSNMHKSYSGDNWMSYMSVYKQSDISTTISEYMTIDCHEKSMKYMIEKSDTVMAVWDGEKNGEIWEMIEYAKGLGKKIVNIQI